jgi:peptide-methionine (R)-S-oxide reductase
MTRRDWLRNTAFAGLAGGTAWLATRRPAAAVDHFAVTHSDAEWRRLLTAEQYYVLRQQGTEPPESSPLDHQFARGRYDCAGCEQALFTSDTKFDSGTGWPSFYQPIDGAVSTSSDDSLMMQRTEVHCSRCGGHLGHVFDDGPKPTGLRYCMNGVALKFVAA